MLIRPLAYKGPNDHLAQHFNEAQLYAGLQLLLQGHLSHWQHETSTQWIHGEFSGESSHLNSRGDSVKSELAWPLTKDGHSCTCEQTKPCAHLAALAIESKRRLHQIVYSVKDFQEKTSLWSSELQWLNQQSFDPYPNMARHRLVYLLKRDSDQFYISFYKAYLTQDNKYLLKDKFDFTKVNFQKLQKFVSLTDQSILHQCLHLIDTGKAKADDNLLYFIDPHDVACDAVFFQMAQSQRCFWKASSRPPIKSQLIHQSLSDLPQVTANAYFDVSHNQLFFVRNTAQSLPKIESIKPKITLVSTQEYLPWRKGEPLQLDIARVSFIVNQSLEFSSEVFIDAKQELSDQHKQTIARHWREIQALPTVKARQEYHIYRQFDLADRYLDTSIGQLCVWLAGLHNEGWIIEIDHSFRLNRKTTDNWYLDLSENNDWFELELGIKVDGESINIMPYLVRAIRNQQINLNKLDQQSDLPIQLENGKLLVLKGERVKQIASTLIELFEKNPLNDKKKIKLSRYQLHRLKQFTQVDEAFVWQSNEQLKTKVDKLSKYSNRKVEIPAWVQAELREYQKQGIQWFRFLRDNGLGGILADDMGLGKTLQTLVHFASIKQQEVNRKPHLIIAPTSLLANWQNEIEKFTPELNSLIFYGSDREQLIDDFIDYDIIITSYGVLQRDVESLKRKSFDTIVLDEAQAIKNARTRIARCCYSLQADHRLCLTGTPMENHLGELWSLFNFLMPGFLGNEAQFNRLYRTAIEKEHNDSVQKALLQRIAPFMLRRTKNKVAKELPPKTELDRLIDMSEEQADLYEAVRLSMTEEIQKALVSQGAGKNQLLISNALLRLRQICCHPQLFKLNSNQAIKPSAKLDWLKSVLPEMIEEGRRILLFSSFTSMLDIIEHYLKESKINYLKLTGQSKNRGDLVNKFQNENIPIFLISLKAGGAGLNLTAADTVIHFDPWWNPAAEDQASDRAYRIGQDKPVFVYKLITRGTVEERILKMQKAKQKLSDKIYANTAADIKSVIDQDWKELFKPLN